MKSRINSILRTVIKTDADAVTICRENEPYVKQTTIITKKSGGLLMAKGKFIDAWIPSYLKNRTEYKVDGVWFDVKYYFENKTEIVRIVRRRYENLCA